jgi:hypothetical protein
MFSFEQAKTLCILPSSAYFLKNKGFSVRHYVLICFMALLLGRCLEITTGRSLQMMKGESGPLY